MTTLQKQQRAARRRRHQRLHLQESRRWERAAKAYSDLLAARAGQQPSFEPFGWIHGPVSPSGHITIPQQPRLTDDTGAVRPAEDIVDDLVRALACGYYRGETGPGSELKVESLEATMRMIVYRSYPRVTESKGKIAAAAVCLFLLDYGAGDQLST